MNYLTAQPFLLDFGVNYRSARLAGSFQILRARKLEALKCTSDHRGRKAIKDSVPGWLELGQPSRTAHGLTWSFRIDSASSGFRSASLSFEFDTGTSTVEIRAAIKIGDPRLGDLVICEKPFNGSADFGSVQTLTRFLKGLDFRIHHLDSIDQRLPRRPRTVLLHGSGLIRAARESLSTINELVQAGTNVIILADKFFLGTADAANKIGEQYGMTLRPGNEGGFRSTRDRIRTNERYSERAQVRPHPLTKGVERMYWHRPWPIECMLTGVIPLINDSEDPRMCYVAAAKRRGYVVMVGTSLWHSMTSVGWPFQNDRLLANLLVGGDAERYAASAAAKRESGPESALRLPVPMRRSNGGGSAG